MLNETVDFKLRFFNRVKLVEASIEVPESDNFLIDQNGKEKSYRQIINGKEFTVTEINYKFTPNVNGNIKIPSFKISGLAIIPDKRRRNMGIGGFFEDSFFNSGFGKRKRIRVKSDPILLSIMDFPEKDKPENFQGLVGDFEIKERLQKVPQNNSYRLIVDLKGKGDLSLVNKINLTSSESFSVYEEESISTNSGKRFSLVIIPKKNGIYTLPVGSFSFFSLSEKKYKKLLYGGQELIFSGVTGSVPAKSEVVNKSPMVADYSLNDARSSGKTKNTTTGMTEIIVSKNNDVLEKITLFIEKWFSEMITVFICFFFYNLFNKKLSYWVRRFLKIKASPLEERLNHIFKANEINVGDLLNWLYEVSVKYKGGVINSIEELKNDPFLDNSIKRSIEKLEGAIFQGVKLTKEELLQMRPDFEKLCKVKR
jgi:hypothetical protein